MTTPKKIMDEKLLKLKEVLERLRISRSNWLDGVKQKKYPQPVYIGLRSVRWIESDIEEYLQRNRVGPGKSAA